MTTGAASQGEARQIGPLRFDVSAPAGWRVERDPDPLAQPFLEARDSADIVVPLRLDLESSDEDRADWRPVLSTGGWRLESHLSGKLRWSLPDPHGPFLWRATVMPEEQVTPAEHATPEEQVSREEQVTVTPGPRLLDRDRRILSTPLRYPLDQLLAIHTLAPKRALVVHSAGWTLDGRALVVAGVSGAGKTTISRLLCDADPRLHGLSDDRILVAPSPRERAIPHQKPNRWWAWGTPWAGEGLVASPAGAALAGLVFLEHADSESLTPLDPSEALQRLLPTASIPWYDPDRAALVLATIGEILADVPAYLLRCRPCPGAADLLVDLLGSRG